MISLNYSFLPMGSTGKPAPHQIYLDVGNRLTVGVIDHHQGDAPDRCTAGLVLDRSDWVIGQAKGLGRHQPLEIVTHRQPDIDAISAIYFVEHLLAGDLPRPAADRWADMVCEIDRGHTRVDLVTPITPYTVFLACLYLAEREQGSNDEDILALAALAAGKSLVAWLVSRLDEGESTEGLGTALASDPAFADEVCFVKRDLGIYRGDLARAERLMVALPRTDGTGIETVPGLWVDLPQAALFKAWARGDIGSSGDPRGFLFTATRLTPTRFIFSVQPDQGLSLKGLGEALEAAETTKRRRLGRERRGQPRPGYASPDPWYDGRAPMHGYTIVDSPHGGTVLDPAEVRGVLDEWVKSPKD